MRSILTNGSVVALLALLVGCGSPGGTKTSSSGSSPYYQDDRPPSQSVDVSKIPDAVPKVEPITRAGNKNPYTVLGKTYQLLPHSRDYRERGVASWYGTKFHGRPTANGETYDMFAMTAAHKTLPIPAYVKVTNLDNGRSVIVRVNDRGPFLHDRIIDLSYAAAKRLGYANKGTARVEVEAIDPHRYQRDNYVEQPKIENEQPVKPGPYLQVGAFSSGLSALQLQSRVQAHTNHPVIIRSTPHRTGGEQKKLFKVLIGPVIDLVERDTLRLRLQSRERLAPFLVHY